VKFLTGGLAREPCTSRHQRNAI